MEGLARQTTQILRIKEGNKKRQKLKKLIITGEKKERQTI